jgi:ribulose-phosphate 3-epimerase
MGKIIPTILTNSPQEAMDKLASLEGLIDKVQIDIIDGVFANNRTIDPEALLDLEGTYKFDFHLMVKNPIDWVEKVSRVGANAIISQIEMMDDQFEYMGKVQEVGALVGIALDLDTPIEKINPEVLGSIDYLLLMGVKAGFGGQPFEEKVLDKIAKADKIRKDEGLTFVIGVDGGIDQTNYKKIFGAGADELAIGERLFEGNLENNLNSFEK